MKSFAKVLPIILLIIGSLGGGVINGILGTGGGILFVYVLSRYLKGDEYTPRDVFASSMAVVLPVSLLSLTTYDSAYLSDGGYMLSIMIPSAIGGIGGAMISRRLRPVLLRRIFALLVIYAGIKMII